VSRQAAPVADDYGRGADARSRKADKRHERRLRARSPKTASGTKLANKKARIVWAMLAWNFSYEPARSVQAA
jgi:hypothetical protein